MREVTGSRFSPGDVAIAKSSALGGIPEWTLDSSVMPRELRLTPFDFTARRT